MGWAVKVGGRDIGRLFDLEGPSTPPGTPPLIGVMVKVDSADATGAKVAALGGRAMPAFDIMDGGRMAVCFDPNGAEFDLWEPRKGPGTDVDSSLPGAPWTPEVMQMPNMQYTSFKLGDAYVAGMLQRTPQMGSMPPHWATYFTVKDVDATAREAVELGGKICVSLKDVPGVGRFCGITSPQGVTFYAITYAR
jgi:predicted enzyme related to lactoylglutathione lyase